MATNVQVLEVLEKFRETYEHDMRGDKSTNADANRGLVGEIRDIKEYIKDYPSITWLFAHKPFATAGAIIGIFVLLMGLYTAGLLKLLAASVGMALP